MSQGEARLWCRTGLSQRFAPHALFQVAVPFGASVIVHAALVATLPSRATPPVSTESPTKWVEAPETVATEPVTPANADDGSELPAPPAAQTREPAAHPPSDAPPAPVNLPPPDAAPGVHGAAQPLVGEARAAWWAAARNVPVGPLDSRDGYAAIRAQIAGWNPKLLTGTYVPRGSGAAHPDETPSRAIPATVIASVIQANAGRFRVCHGAGLPQSATISGQVLVAFVIKPDGHVSAAHDAGGMSFPDDAVRACVVRAVSQLSFPKPPDGGTQQVTTPILLDAEEAMARRR